MKWLRLWRIQWLRDARDDLQARYEFWAWAMTPSEKRVNRRDYALTVRKLSRLGAKL